MVKNTIGGKKGKMFASKNAYKNGNSMLRISTNAYEKYVCVTKVFGGGMFEAVDNENTPYSAILRGKMKGPNKRFNLVSLFSFLLVGLRQDSSDLTCCDILFVYDSNDIRTISLLPSSNIANIYYLHLHHSLPSSSNDHDHDHDLFSTSDNTTLLHSNSNSNSNSHSISASENISNDFEVDFHLI
jgi:hypothetical protein